MRAVQLCERDGPCPAYVSTSPTLSSQASQSPHLWTIPDVPNNPPSTPPHARTEITLPVFHLSIPSPTARVLWARRLTTHPPALAFFRLSERTHD